MLTQINPKSKKLTDLHKGVITLVQLQRQYKELERDITDLKASLVPLLQIGEAMSCPEGLVKKKEGRKVFTIIDAEATVRMERLKNAFLDNGEAIIKIGEPYLEVNLL